VQGARTWIALSIAVVLAAASGAAVGACGSSSSSSSGSTTAAAVAAGSTGADTGAAGRPSTAPAATTTGPAPPATSATGTTSTPAKPSTTPTTTSSKPATTTTPSTPTTTTPTTTSTTAAVATVSCPGGFDNLTGTYSPRLQSGWYGTIRAANTSCSTAIATIMSYGKETGWSLTATRHIGPYTCTTVVHQLGAQEFEGEGSCVNGAVKIAWTDPPGD
jgi:hypothetical protein